MRRYVAEQPVAVSWDGAVIAQGGCCCRYRTPIAIAALLILAIAITAVLTELAVARCVERRQTRSAASAAQIAPRPSAAVIGFRNLSGRPADEWLSTAMAEMLTTELAGDGQMRVVPAERVARADVDLGHHAAATLSQEAVERLRNTLASDS